MDVVDDEAVDRVRDSLARVREQVSTRCLDSLRQEVSEALTRELAINAAVYLFGSGRPGALVVNRTPTFPSSRRPRA